MSTPRTKTGVYCWRNLANGKIYVGGAYVSLAGRRKSHLARLQKGNHANKHFQAAWNKYGEESFRFEVLERCSPRKVQRAEQKWLNFYHAGDPQWTYNKSQTAGSLLGYKFSEEVKARKSVAMKTSPAAIAQRKRLALTNRGRKMSAAERKQRSLAQKGRIISAETKAKMSVAKRGIKQSREHVLKATAHMKGNTYGTRLSGRTHTPERRAIQSEAMRGNRNGSLGRGKPKTFLTEEQREKVRKLYATGRYSQPTLARKFGVNGSTIGKIVKIN